MKYVPLVRKTLTKFRPLFLARTNWNKILPRESSVRMMLLPMQSLYVQNFKIRDGFSSKIPVFLKVIFEVQKLASVVLEISLNDMSRVAYKSSKFSVSTQLKWYLLIYSLEMWWTKQHTTFEFQKVVLQKKSVRKKKYRHSHFLISKPGRHHQHSDNFNFFIAILIIYAVNFLCWTWKFGEKRWRSR